MKAVSHICFLILFSAFVASLVLSCSRAAVRGNTDIGMKEMKISEGNRDEFNIAEFERNRALWTSKNIQNYKIVVAAQGFLTNFPEEVLIEVRNQKAVSTQSLSKTGKNYVQGYKQFNSIDMIFDFVEKESQKKPDLMTIEYDSELGYPKNVGLDERRGISDDELSLTISKLEIIK